jgi:hypothetical protein
MVWAVLQFALPAAASVADARLQREALGARAHAEAGTTATCRPTHNADCGLCQSLSRAQSLATGPQAWPEAVAIRAPMAADAQHTVQWPLRLLPPSRAPPVV